MFNPTLVEFLFRLTLGVAVAMGLTPAAQVTSGFYRVHLWVLMGVQTLAAVALWSRPSVQSTGVPVAHWQLGCALAAAILCYVGAAIWMYERRLAGKIVIWIVAGLALAGCLLPLSINTEKAVGFQIADRLTSGLLLGFVTTAMLLGHWYLNTPTMKLAPLARLIVLLAFAVIVRAIVCGAGAAMELTLAGGRQGSELTTWLVFLGLRWLAGIAGVLGVTWLTWLVLKIPNTQSATGLSYAGVILAFIGELTSLLLSAEGMYPL